MADDSKLTLPRWLAKMLTSGQCPGLEMLDPDQLTFKIPWQNQKSGGLKPESDDAIFLQAWATHRNYKQTDPKIWKQNFRCALNKCKKEIEKLEQKEQGSKLAYRIYKFKRNFFEDFDHTEEITEEHIPDNPEGDQAISEIDFQSYQSGDLSVDSFFSSSYCDLDEEMDTSCLTLTNEGREISREFVSESEDSNTSARDVTMIMDAEVMYDVPHQLVLTKQIFSNTPLCDIFYEPDSATFAGDGSCLLQLPGVEALQFSPKYKKELYRRLSDLSQGVKIKYQNDDIYVQRKCRMRVYCTDGFVQSVSLPASDCEFTQVFSYSQFLIQLKQHTDDDTQPIPKDYFVLAFGNNVIPGDNRPMRNVIVAVRIRHSLAATELNKWVSQQERIPDPLNSNLDSVDNVVNFFQNLHLTEPNLNQNLHLTEPNPAQMTIDSARVNEIPLQVRANTLPLLSIEVYYDVPHKQVLAEYLSTPQWKILYDCIATPAVRERIGPENGEGCLTLPSVNILSQPSKHKEKIAERLKNLARGFSIKYENDDIYIERRCPIRIFISDGATTSMKLDRRQNRHADPVFTKVFDYQQFKLEMAQCVANPSERRPKDHVFVIVGNDIIHNDSRPFRKSCLYFKLLHVRAAVECSKYQSSAHWLPEAEYSLPQLDQSLVAF